MFDWLSLPVSETAQLGDVVALWLSGILFGISIGFSLGSRK